MSRLRHLEFLGVTQARRPAVQGDRGKQPRLALSLLGSRFLKPAEPVDPFILWMFGRAGLDASHYQSAPLNRRLGASLRSIRAASTEEARGKIERLPELLTTAMQAILLGVTEFFRDPTVFEDLRGLLPSLAKHGQGLRIWSAACSDGQELYSVALMLAEVGLLSTSVLLGTDCRPDAIERARAGQYEAACLEGIRPALRYACFFPVEGRPGLVRVEESIQTRVRWQTEDLLSRVQPGPWDMILWRNHAIYLNVEAVVPLWHRLTCALRTGGLLVTGRAERPDRALPLKRVAACIYRKL